MIERTCENGHKVQISDRAIKELRDQFGLDATEMAQDCPECHGRVLDNCASCGGPIHMMSQVTYVEKKPYHAQCFDPVLRTVGG